MLGAEQARELWANSEEIISEDTVRGSLNHIAEEIIEKIDDTLPMVLSVVGGAAVSTGVLPSKLVFPLKLDCIHLPRYSNMTVGGEMQWRVAPCESAKGRTVLVLDDILDEGEIMTAIHSRVINMGAAGFYSAALCEKALARSKPLYPDFCDLNVPDRHVSGCGMDAKGYWRNLPTIHAPKNTRRGTAASKKDDTLIALSCCLHVVQN